MKISKAYEVLNLENYPGFDRLMEASKRVARIALDTHDPQLNFRANEATVTILVSEDWMTFAQGVVVLAEINKIDQEVKRPNQEQRALIKELTWALKL